MEANREEKRNPLLYLFGKLWLYSKSNRKKVVLYWFLFVVATSIIQFGPPLIWSRMMNAIQENGISSTNIRLLVVLLLMTLCAEFGFWCLHGPARVIENNNAFWVSANYRKFLLKGVMMLPMEWHVEHHTGDTTNKVEKGTNALSQFSRGSFEVIYAVVQLVVSYIMLSYFFHPAAIIVLVMILATAWTIIRFDRVMISQYRELNWADNLVSESVTDTITNITTVIILRVEKLVFDAIVGRIAKPYDLFRKNNRLNELKWFCSSMWASGMTVLVFGAYFLANLNGPKSILIGNVYILLKYLDRMGDVFYRFTYLYSDIVVQKSRIANAEELASDFRAESFTDHVMPAGWRRLEIRNLNFSYGGNSTDLNLRDVALSFGPGERIALVGPNGSGKTTLLKIISNLYKPQDLDLSVDGVSIDGFGGIIRAITLVPQDPEIFTRTIRENITLGADHDDAFIRRFTDMACLSDVVERLPNKLESTIKEKGVNLSGGEKQRLALTRGLLACYDKDVVLLDEPTASVDAVNERQIYENIFREFKDKTIFSTVHKLHLLPLFDRIYFFDGGRILASGSLSELQTLRPEFQKMMQAYTSGQDGVQQGNIV